MIAKIGWKNVWRKKGRSLLVILSVAIGIWVGLFFGGFQWGMYVQKLDDIVNRELGHVQIHANDFIDEEYDYNFPIQNPSHVREVLDADTSVKTYVERAIFSAMLQTTRDQSPVLVYGIDTVEEQNFHSITSMLVEGEMVKGKRAPTLVIGKALADELDIKLGAKLSVQGGMLHGVKSFVGRVRAIYESPNKMKDKMMIYVHKSDLEAKLGDDFSHEFAVVFNKFDSLKVGKKRLASQLPELEVLTWGELMPEIENGIEMTDAVMFIIMMIIWFALALGIVNTMLMSVLERSRELGMLMSIGMSRFKIVKMIFFETSVLTMIGVPVGLFLTYITIAYFGKVGIDLSIADSAISDFGYSSIIYPVVKESFYMQVVVQVIIVSLVSTVFPALRVLRMRPVDAVRKS